MVYLSVGRTKLNSLNVFFVHDCSAVASGHQNGLVLMGDVVRLADQDFVKLKKRSLEGKVVGWGTRTRCLLSLR